MDERQNLIDELTILMKQKKYKKQKRTWFRENDDLVILFGIQYSSYGDEYYINLGIIIKKLLKEGEGVSFFRCHIIERVNNKNEYGIYLTADQLMAILDLWEKWYGDINALRIKAVEGKLPYYCTAEARTFLTTVRFG